MFYDGLHNRADIFTIRRTASNRGGMSDTLLSEQPVLKNVPCRVIRDSKILFEPSVKLSDGDTVRDNATGIIYEITAAKPVSGINLMHHRSYTVRKKHQSAAFTLTQGET